MSLLRKKGAEEMNERTEGRTGTDATRGGAAGTAGTDMAPRGGAGAEMTRAAGTAMRGAAGTGVRALRIEDYEARIWLYREQAVNGYIGIGKTLNEAKQSGVVPHGEWEEWVERTTGLSLRNAQRCMKAAAEIRDGSWLGQLDMSKAMLLLSSGLDEETQESLAEKSARDGGSVREMREEIRRLKGALDTAGKEAREAREKAEIAGQESEEKIRKLKAAMATERADADETIKALKLKVVDGAGGAAEMREALKRAEGEKADLVRQMKALNDGMRARMDQEAGNAYRRGLQERDTKAEKEIRESVRKEYEMNLNMARSELADSRETEKELRKALQEANAGGSARWDEGYNAGVGYGKEMAEKDWTERLEEMRKDLAAAEEREARRARELAELKKEKARAGMDSARGIRTEGAGALDLAGAVRSFIGAAGVLPQMGNLIAGMSESEREAVRAQVETVAEWVRASRAALGTVMAEASIV